MSIADAALIMRTSLSLLSLASFVFLAACGGVAASESSHGGSSGTTTPPPATTSGPPPPAVTPPASTCANPEVPEVNQGGAIPPPPRSVLRLDLVYQGTTIGVRGFRGV